MLREHWRGSLSLTNACGAKSPFVEQAMRVRECVNLPFQKIRVKDLHSVVRCCCVDRVLTREVLPALSHG